MKNRALIILGAAAIALGGCSGSKKAEGDAAAKPAAKADAKGGKEKPHNNPWAKDAPAAEAPAPAKKAEGDAKAKDKPKDNPWAKDPPPGSVPSEAAKDDKKK